MISSPSPEPDGKRVETGGGSYIEQGVTTGGGDFVNRDKIIYQGGEPLTLPTPDQWLAYARAVQQAYARWADQPDTPEPPLYQQGDDPRQAPDAYIGLRATLPMRVAEFRPQADGREAPAQELLVALAHAHRTIILGEPGSGKTTALERLAWVTATQALQESHAARTIPIFTRLADYQGDADLISLLTRALNRHNAFTLSEAAARRLLQDRHCTIVLLLDGLNEFARTHQSSGPAALRHHLDDYPTTLSMSPAVRLTLTQRRTPCPKPPCGRCSRWSIRLATGMINRAKATCAPICAATWGRARANAFITVSKLTTNCAPWPNCLSFSGCLRRPVAKAVNCRRTVATWCAALFVPAAC